MKSFTEDGLSSISDFEPPSSVFDFTRTGDGSLICVHADSKYIFMGNEKITKLHVFVALVRDQNGDVFAFVPDGREDLNRSSSRLFVDGTVFAKMGNPMQLPNQEMIRVRKIKLTSDNFDWSDPDATFDPKEIHGAVYSLGGVTEVHLTYEKIEVLEAGKTVKDKKTSSISSHSASFATQPGIASQQV